MQSYMENISILTTLNPLNNTMYRQQVALIGAHGS